MRTYPSWRNLQRIQSRTQCIYAPKARNWGNPPWREELSLEENLSLLLPYLVRFVDVSREQRLDGYGIDLPGRHGADTARMLILTAGARARRGAAEMEPFVLPDELTVTAWVQAKDRLRASSLCRQLSARSAYSLELDPLGSMTGKATGARATAPGRACASGSR